VALFPGNNLVSWSGEAVHPTAVVSSADLHIVAIYEWDYSIASWRRYISNLPAFMNTLSILRPGGVYWIIIR
jgi:undecaprenyl pyrophosphate synthase